MSDDAGGIPLGDFIAHALIQIIDGVRTAQGYAAGVGAEVNPAAVPDGGQFRMPVITGGRHDETNTAERVVPVEFDIATTATHGKGTTAGIGVLAAAVTLGVGRKADAGHAAVNRIRFSVLVKLPPQRPAGR